MVRRFRDFCDMAEARGLRLVVGILTGWMSGRLFVPPALERRELLTDPAARMWEVRFVRRFVRETRDRPAIVAWDVGNECNCMGRASREEAWAWLYEITAAQSLLYAGVSGRPCFPEEAGDMGRNVCSEARAAGSVRAALFTSWACGLRAFLWWCAFDQVNHEPRAVECPVSICGRIGRVWLGAPVDGALALPPHGIAVFEVAEIFPNRKTET